jgi:hypothetical protein
MKRLILLATLAAAAGGRGALAENWYENSFYLLHEDHHTSGEREVGRDADPAETAKLVALAAPDVIQIHAKGNPGWTTYPTKIGHAPPKLACDVLGLWRDAARQGGYPFSAYYNIGRDGEIMTRRPEWNRADAAGKPWDRALCYHSGVAEDYLWPMIREIIEGYRPDGFWFDGSCFTVRVCYCEKCRDRFRREQGLAPPKSPADKGWAEYQEMQRQVYREFIHRTAALIHESDPQCLVAVNWAYSLRMPERPDPEIAYLTGDIGNRVEGLSAEAHWCDSQQLPFDLMTQISTLRPAENDGRRQPPRMAPKPRVQIEQEMAVIVANDGRYFAWDSPTPESGLVPERFEFLAKVVAPFLRAREPWCLGWQRVPEVSLLHSAAAHYAVGDNTTVSFDKSDSRIDGAADALARLHLNYEMLPDWRLAGLDVRSPLLIVEHPKVLTRETVDSLIEFVQDGGRLLMTGMGVTRDKRLADPFGIAEYSAPQGAEPLSVRPGGEVARFSHWLFRLECGSASRLLAVEDAAGQVHPILTENRFGQGAACYVPIPLLSKHGENVVPEALLESIFEALLPARRRLVTTDAPATVEIGLRQKGLQYALHLVNLAPGQRETITDGGRTYRSITSIPPVAPCRVSVRLSRKPSRVELQPQNVPLQEWRFEDGRLEAEVPGFEIHQMLIATVDQ